MAADDMGLGKTLTMISLVLKQREAAGAAGKTGKKKEEEWLARNSESFPSNYRRVIFMSIGVFQSFLCDQTSISIKA